MGPLDRAYELCLSNPYKATACVTTFGKIGVVALVATEMDN